MIDSTRVWFLADQETRRAMLVLCEEITFHMAECYRCRKANKADTPDYCDEIRIKFGTLGRMGQEILSSANES